MAGGFEKSLKVVLGFEGGYVNHPRDPGGATNRGVIQRSYDRFRKARGYPSRPVRQITDAEVYAIYKHDYWDRVAGDLLPPGLDLATFDGAVNSGVSRGAKWLQASIGVAADGIVGPQTVSKAREVLEPTKVIRAMCAKRLSFLQRLSHWSTFKRGWSRRVAKVEVLATEMALDDLGYTAKSKAAHMAGTSQKLEKGRKQNGKAAAVAGSGGASAGLGAEQLDAASSSGTIWFIALVLAVAAGVYLYKRASASGRLAAYRQRLAELAEEL